MFNLFKKNKKVPIINDSNRLADLEDLKLYKTNIDEIDILWESWVSQKLRNKLEINQITIISHYINTYNFYQVKLAKELKEKTKQELVELEKKMTPELISVLQKEYKTYL